MSTRKRVPTGLFAIAYVACYALFWLTAKSNIKLCKAIGRSFARAMELTHAQTSWLTGPYNDALAAAIAQEAVDGADGT